MGIQRLFRNLTDYNDSLLARVEIGDRMYNTKIPLEGEYLLGLAFGGRETHATQSLARSAIDARKISEKNLPLIAQWAILVNIPKIRFDDYSIDSETKGSAPYEASLNTREVMERARQFIIEEHGQNSLKHAIYLAHPAHMERVIGIGKKLDFQGIPFVDADIVGWNTGQEHLGAGATVSPSKWLKRELVTRLNHIIKGWM